MKALCIREPWASMILSGQKTIETRRWKTSYRGPILLCASRKPIGPLIGKAFAIAKIIDIHPMTLWDTQKACCGVYPGAFAWVFEDVTPLNSPFDVKGKLGLFEVKYYGRGF